MTVLQWRPGLLSAPVGNNSVNEPDDIIAMKDAYARVGRYNKPERNGYIDQELNKAIHGIQRDYNLKRDGYMNPGGETEATLIGEALGIEKRPEPNEQTKVASAAPAIPAIATSLAEILGTTAAGAMALWQSMHKDKREKVLDNIAKTSKELEYYCDKNYQRKTDVCNAVTAKKGSAAGTICHQSAAAQYGACLAGESEDNWPPLRK